MTPLEDALANLALARHLWRAHLLDCPRCSTQRHRRRFHYCTAGGTLRWQLGKAEKWVKTERELELAPAAGQAHYSTPEE